MSTETRPIEELATKWGTNTSFGPLKQIDAGVLNVGYAEAGPGDGPAVILLQTNGFNSVEVNRAGSYAFTCANSKNFQILDISNVSSVTTVFTSNISVVRKYMCTLF